MGALTDDRPKPMLEVAGKTLLEHKLDALPNDVDEVIIVVGYMGGKIHDHFGGVWKDKHILYVEQENPTGGTAEALWLARPLLHGKFLVMNGDNLYTREDMTKCVAYDWAVLVEQRDDIRTGLVAVDDEGFVTSILENTDHQDTGIRYANTGLYALDTRVFNYQPLPKAPHSSELGLPQTIVQAAKDIPIRAVPTHRWFEIKAPEDLAKAEEFLRGDSAY